MYTASLAIMYNAANSASVADVMRYTCASSVDGPAVTGARLNYAAALDASVGEGDLPPGKQRVADCSTHVRS